MDDVTRRVYADQGYCRLKNCLPSAVVEAVHAEAQAIFATQMDRLGIGAVDDANDFDRRLYELFQVDHAAFLAAARQCQQSIAMHRLAVSSDVMDIVTALGLELPTICVKPIIYFNSPRLAKIEGHYKTPPHQDWRSMQGSLNAMVVWIPIVDVDVPLGAIEIVPGSHRLGLLGTEADSWYRHIADPAVTDSSFVPVEVERGDVVCFSALLVHRSGNNVTDRIRWSMHFRYNDVAEATFVERGLPHPYTVYQPQPDLLTSDFPTPEEIARIFPAAT